MIEWIIKTHLFHRVRILAVIASGTCGNQVVRMGPATAPVRHNMVSDDLEGVNHTMLLLVGSLGAEPGASHGLLEGYQHFLGQKLQTAVTAGVEIPLKDVPLITGR
jgi:hypothetical protein